MITDDEGKKSHVPKNGNGAGWWNSGKDFPPLPSEGRACPSPFDCHGPRHWDLALVWVLAALSAAQEPRLPEIQILGHRMIPFVSMSDWRALPVFCGFSERWQRTSAIVRGVSERRRLQRKFMKTASALIYGNQNTRVTSPPAPMHTMARDLCARVARPSGKTSRFTVRDAVAASEQPAVRAVATRLVMASSSFQEH